MPGQVRHQTEAGPSKATLGLSRAGGGGRGTVHDLRNAGDPPVGSASWALAGKLEPAVSKQVLSVE